MIELEELVRTGFLSQMAEIYTALPCRVVKVNLSESRMDVQPSLLDKFKDDTTEELPVILGVPIVYPSSSKSSFTFPIAEGDGVLCVFSQRGLDTFKMGKGGLVEPLDFRKFDIRDAVALPGLFPFSKSVNKQSNRSLPHSTNDAVISHNLGTGSEVEVRLKSDGSVLIKSPKTVTVDCKDATVNASSSMTVSSPSTSWSGDVTYTGNITINGVLVVDGVNMNSHIHGGVTPGPGFTSTPQ